MKVFFSNNRYSTVGISGNKMYVTMQKLNLQNIPDALTCQLLIQSQIC